MNVVGHNPKAMMNQTMKNFTFNKLTLDSKEKKRGIVYNLEQTSTKNNTLDEPTNGTY